MKLRRLREGDVLEDGGITLVRGGGLEPDVLRADAMRYHSVYGSCGTSVFAPAVPRWTRWPSRCRWCGSPA